MTKTINYRTQQDRDRLARAITNRGLGYEELRMIWRASLDDATVRSLASDHRLGLQDESTYDGLLEYRYRFGMDHVRSERCPVHLRGPVPVSCVSCRLLMVGQDDSTDIDID